MTKPPSAVKTLVLFDLDGTLAESKSAVDAEMSGLIRDLLQVTRIGVISGGGWPQFLKQLLPGLENDPGLANLTLMPISGAELYVHRQVWTPLYSHAFTPDERAQIIADLDAALRACAFEIPQVWGPQIEDRGGQVTLSVLGQQAPIAAKLKWDPDQRKRLQLVDRLRGNAVLYSAHIGGATSVDVTRPGVDKASGVQQISGVLGISVEHMLFIGDALFAGGNDFPVKSTGVATLCVRDAEETKRIIETLLACRTGVGF